MLPAFESKIAAALDRARQDRVVERLWQKDASLWKPGAQAQAEIRNSLGWLDLPETMPRAAAEIEAFCAEIRASGFKHALVLGMGGSSLAPEVFRQAFAPKAGFPTLLVLDSTDPDSVAFAASIAQEESTLYIVSSKSGTTTEPLRFFDYFYGRAKARLGQAEAGRHFAAITDPGSFLETLAREKGFRRIFLNPPDIGGRYSALSYFGLVPAALAGIDIKELLRRAAAMRQSCAPAQPPERNPALWLGAALGVLAAEGIDKVTFLVSPEISALGLWLEQLLAESTGKEGRGIVPVSDEPLLDASSYGPDRVFVQLRLENSRDEELPALAESVIAAHPLIELRLRDPLDLGAEFYRWETATAVLGRALGINPFDQPNVQEAKDRTKKVLKQLSDSGALPAPEHHSRREGLSLTFSGASWDFIRGKNKAPDFVEALRLFLADRRPGDYIGLLAYLNPWNDCAEELRAIQRELQSTGLPLQTGYGPRYLHSTGQLHKGGPNSGIFLILSRADAPALKIEGCGYSFGDLVRAQALGDFLALSGAGRRAVFIEFSGAPPLPIKKIAGALRAAASAGA